MFIEASVNPAKPSRSAARGLIGRRPPRIGMFIAAARRLCLCGPRPWQDGPPALDRTPALLQENVSALPAMSYKCHSSRPDGVGAHGPTASPRGTSATERQVCAQAGVRRALASRQEDKMDYRKEFRVEPDTKVKLKKLDPGYKGRHESPEEAKGEI